MTTSPQMLFRSVASLEDKPLPPVILGYFHGLAQDEAHDVILSLFMERAETAKITRAFLARRLGKSPEQITRWLAAPGNWTLDTYTNFAVAMGCKPKFGVERLSELRQGNEHHDAVSRALLFDMAPVEAGKRQAQTQTKNSADAKVLLMS